MDVCIVRKENRIEQHVQILFIFILETASNFVATFTSIAVVLTVCLLISLAVMKLVAHRNQKVKEDDSGNRCTHIFKICFNQQVLLISLIYNFRKPSRYFALLFFLISE